MAEFDGIKAVVTGGAGGIGAATAAVLAGRGAAVAVLDLAPAPVPDRGAAIVCDLAEPEEAAAAVEEAASALGGIDVVVNNAGVGAEGDVSANHPDEWSRMFRVNVGSIAWVTSAALPHLRESEHAAVVNTASTVALVGVPHRALYSATKGAVLALTLAMAADHVSEGIRFNAVAPGTTDTPWVQRLLAAAPFPEEAGEALRRRQPIGRLVTPQEVAHAVAYLASPLSASTTGTVLTVDGGMVGLRLPRG